MSAYENIREKLDGNDAVLLDGATGSELVRRGIRWRWHGLRTDPYQVEALHREYIAAGVDVIRTNTFQLNGRIYLNVFRDADHMRHIGAPGVEGRAQELTLRATEVARAAREAAGRDVAIAGVLSPLEHCFRPDLAPPEEEATREHAEIARLLVSGRVDLLLLESMNTIAEARAAAQAALETGLPVWASFVLGPEGQILSGERLSDGVGALEELGIDAILVNCAPPEDISQTLPALIAAAGRPVGAFAQIGKFNPPSWKFEFHPQFVGTERWPPQRYAEMARGWVESGVKVVGGCCGTTPDHIRAVKEAL